jgi:hypothetical protein
MVDNPQRIVPLVGRVFLSVIFLALLPTVWVI